MLAAVRERWNVGERGARPPQRRSGHAGRSPGLKGLWADCRRFKRDLFDNGGAAIETPDPEVGPDAIFARTVVQADGDVLCFVTERYGDDAGLRQEHDARTDEWFGRLHATVAGISATTRTATRWVSVAVVAVTTVTVTAVSTIIVGLLVAVVTGVAVPVLVRQGLRFLIGRLLS